MKRYESRIIYTYIFVILLSMCYVICCAIQNYIAMETLLIGLKLHYDKKL